MCCHLTRLLLSFATFSISLLNTTSILKDNMLGSITLVGIAFAANVIAAPADPTITAPAILPRQNNDQFVGWVQSSGKCT